MWQTFPGLLMNNYQQPMGLLGMSGSGWQNLFSQMLMNNPNWQQAPAAPLAPIPAPVMTPQVPQPQGRVGGYVPTPNLPPQNAVTFPNQGNAVMPTMTQVR